jgi:IS5 family transposase
MQEFLFCRNAKKQHQQLHCDKKTRERKREREKRKERARENEREKKKCAIKKKKKKKRAKRERVKEKRNESFAIATNARASEKLMAFKFVTIFFCTRACAFFAFLLFCFGAMCIRVARSGPMRVKLKRNGC